MFEMLYVFIAVVGSLWTGIYDLKTSDVPDNVIYFMIASGIGLHLAEAFTLNNFNLFIDMIVVGIVFSIIGFIMYRTKQWGGGDSTLLIAIGVLTATLTSTFLPFALSFFINLSIIGAFYSILYAIIVANRNGADKIFYKKVKNEKNTILKVTGFLFLVFLIVAYYFSFYEILIMPIVVLFVMLFSYFIKSIDEGFRKRISVLKLKEGDVVGEDIPKAGIYSKYIKGITKKDIAKIKKYKKFVIVLDGIRYTPAFAIALLFTLIYGDVITLFFL